ncbi:MAG: F0F1 ATP synthase subunit B [bacterium]
MEEAVQIQAGTETPATGAHEASTNVMKVEPIMVGLTWITFALLTLVLYKVAWKPILKVLDMREKSIRDALTQAEAARVGAEATVAKNREMLQAAEKESQRLVAEARVAAQESARLIREQAEQKTKTLVEEAGREIAAATDQARIALRREATEISISLAGKILGANMDTERNRVLVNDLSKEIQHL